MPRTPSQLPDLDLGAVLSSAELVDGDVTRKARGKQPSPFDKLLEDAWKLEKMIRFPVPTAAAKTIIARLRTAAKNMNMGLHASDPKKIEGDPTLPDHVMIEVKPMPLRERPAKAATAEATPAEGDAAASA